jgi:hypothetical protein
MATEFDVVDKVDRSTAELLSDSDDAIIAWGETEAFVMEQRDDEE